ncbi:MAG: glycosyltransferase [Thermomonas sp.]|uniref:glycosyltransferase family 2 protein n=1 Tax=Thermomonas sp. TaxID=1971895 RepID=UPI001ECC388A|nr:glycosyltransferase [Thermomonas sp.]MBV2208070.1 glycosyltransferase [Thermomonas sp.]
MSFVKDAQTAHEAGDFAQAVSLYEQAILARPELAAMYRFNLERARAKLGAAASGNVNERPQPAGTTIYLADLYREVAQAVARLPARALTDPQPWVSVVMTTHNVADYVEQAVTSLLRQTYSPLEIIVVDDCSTDTTWPILQRLKREYPIVIRRLNANLGTYFAKNFGVRLARGEFVFFQDGDDLCHPERIRLCMHELRQPSVMCVQSSYSRVLFPAGQVLPVNGLVKKLGLITLGVRRAVFDEIGFFNCTMKASDDEFFQRLQALYRDRPDAVRVLDLPLYYNTLREGSLFADMITNDPAADGRIEQRLSPVRQQYLEAFQALHQNVPHEQFRTVFRFPVTRDVISVLPEMSRLANPALPVVASVCSIPERQALLQRMLASLAPQLDELHVYLDRYDAVPDFVRDCHPKVTVRLSRDLPGLRDNGKLVPLLGRQEACYFFTADDDIEYPPDYVNALVKKIEHYGHLAVVGVHGVRIPEQPTGYFSGFRRVHWFIRELEQDRLVNNLGTGTVAFHSDCVAGLDYRSFAHSGMVDLYLAAFCKTRGVPMVAVARPENWLVQLDEPVPQNGVKNLFVEGSQNDDKQSRLVRQHAPWGYAAIVQAVEAASRKTDDAVVGERLRALLPVLQQCLM